MDWLHFMDFASMRGTADILAEFFPHPEGIGLAILVVYACKEVVLRWIHAG